MSLWQGSYACMRDSLSMQIRVTYFILYMVVNGVFITFT